MVITDVFVARFELFTIGNRGDSASQGGEGGTMAKRELGQGESGFASAQAELAIVFEQVEVRSDAFFLDLKKIDEIAVADPPLINDDVIVRANL